MKFRMKVEKMDGEIVSADVLDDQETRDYLKDAGVEEPITDEMVKSTIELEAVKIRQMLALRMLEKVMLTIDGVETEFTSDVIKSFSVEFV